LVQILREDMIAAISIARLAIGLPFRRPAASCVSNRDILSAFFHQIPSAFQLPFKQVKYGCELGQTTITRAMMPGPAMAITPPARRRDRLWQVFRSGSLSPVFVSGGHPSHLFTLHTAFGEPQ
jgi:hypothetical protein